MLFLPGNVKRFVTKNIMNYPSLKLCMYIHKYLCLLFLARCEARALRVTLGLGEKVRFFSNIRDKRELEL